MTINTINQTITVKLLFDGVLIDCVIWLQAADRRAMVEADGNALVVLRAA